MRVSTPGEEEAEERKKEGEEEQRGRVNRQEVRVRTKGRVSGPVQEGSVVNPYAIVLETGHQANEKTNKHTFTDSNFTFLSFQRIAKTHERGERGKRDTLVFSFRLGTVRSPPSTVDATVLGRLLLPDGY